MTDSRIGAVVAFMEERPAHSNYHVRSLVESISGMEGLQILVLANGVTPSGELREFLASNSSVTLIEVKPNIGLPLAWNMGIDLLDCDVLFFLNDDLAVDRHCLRKIAEVFKTHPETAVCGVEGIISKSTDTDGFPLCAKKFKKTGWPIKFSNVVEISAAAGFMFAVSGEFMKKTGFRFDPRFSPAFCEELDLALSARTKGYSIRIVTGLDRHYDHVHGISAGPKEINYLGRTVKSDELTERNKKLFLEKWRGKVPMLFGP